MIGFEIRAPRNYNPVELGLARDMVVELVFILHKFLQMGKRLLKIKIALVNTLRSAWIHRGYWCHSVFLGEEIDVECIPGPFRVLRNIETVHIKLPVNTTLRYGRWDDDFYLDTVLQWLNSSMLLSEEFGTQKLGTYLPKLKRITMMTPS